MLVEAVSEILVGEASFCLAGGFTTFKEGRSLLLASFRVIAVSYGT